MQTVSSAFTAEERSTVRKIAQSLLVSWKKESNLSGRTFTIGTSSIGGNDIIGISIGSIGGPGIYNYFDESDYLLSLAWERGLNFPAGGLTKGLAEAQLDNTSGRFTPRHMAGNSELFTAILPRRPFIINAGFNYGGIDNLIPQFSGILTKQPYVNKRDGYVSIQGADYLDFLENRFVDQESMFTYQRTDQVIESILSSLGMATSQYELDPGINVIPFGIFDKGTRLTRILHQLAEAENGHIYQDEEGKIRFENRQHWDLYDTVQKLVLTGQVINVETPREDHIVNVVEIRGEKRSKQPEQTIFRLNTLDSITIPPGEVTEVFVDFENPALSISAPSSSSDTSFFRANTLEDGTGEDISSNVSVARTDEFAKAAKLFFENAGTDTAYITELVISGRPAIKEREIYYREQDDSSVTAFEERTLSIDNPYIQDDSWARSYARMILNDFSEIENLQKVHIRAIPELQVGDLISWQGRYWRVFDIKSQLNPSVGFIQELTLLQRNITTYFRIGFSSIGGSDLVAP